VTQEIRLHAFSCGTVRLPLHRMKLNQGLGQPYEVPIPWYLIEHPAGLVLIDGGNAAQCATDAATHWNTTPEGAWPVMSPKDACVPAMMAAGFDPADVAVILQSHLHLDHTGAIAALDDFPNAQVIAARAEYEYACAPAWFSKGSYIQEDFNKPGVPWVLLDARDDGYDLFADGTIRCWQTPGHSMGHQSFEVTLGASGTVLLAIDAAYSIDHWEDRALPVTMTSAIDVVRSVQRLHRIARRTNATVIFGHDPVQWASVRRSPAFYG
jgi:N-acyl homoserine lactone hydrolase